MKTKKTCKNLLVLYLRYPQYGKSDNKPLGILKNILSDFECKVSLISIDNAAAKSFSKKISSGYYEISGDNTFLEFSGWQRGLEFAMDSNIEYDTCFFVNDMFFHDHYICKKNIKQSMLDCSVYQNALIGKRMQIPLPGYILEYTVVPYVRTNAFILAKKPLDALGPLVDLRQFDIEELFISQHDPSINLFKENAPLSDNIKNLIFSHITTAWHRKRPYTLENFRLLKSKAISILNALLLSAKIYELAFPVIDYEKVDIVGFDSLSPNEINKIWINNPLYKTKEHQLNIKRLYLHRETIEHF